MTRLTVHGPVDAAGTDDAPWCAYCAGLGYVSVQLDVDRWTTETCDSCSEDDIDDDGDGGRVCGIVRKADGAERCELCCEPLTCGAAWLIRVHATPDVLDRGREAYAHRACLEVHALEALVELGLPIWADEQLKEMGFA